MVRSAAARVLVVEDDVSLGRLLTRSLRRAGYTAILVADGASALEQAASTDPPDLVLLDLGLPDLDGNDVCRRMRGLTDSPVIVITARAEEADRVRALDLGADDYLVKPFGLAELLARIRAVRRRAVRATAAAASGNEILRHGPIAVDLRSRQVHLNGHPVALTAKEFDLLACLAHDPGRALRREEILAAVWGEWFGSSRALDVHVGALRRKLGPGRYIETVYGVGFRLVDPTTAPTGGHR
ncbi:response regulator transcription factor [Frankia sp. AgPm24]|uniref:response regulator transcription factor n=1 Tax=Frankia sp. AgPm24 TaxID=631128 RepID=UPI002010200A|nr:response regulator transcription factor [Frankia sp. AgPm24]MCK9925019.1 response regulator transcription factor [Frankia sp. AgPm24]